MLSFLDMVNHYLGYINISLKIKNRIYTVLGLLGDFYLFYIAVRYMKNSHPFWGLLILAVALILLYFAFLNGVYYFTTKKAPFDISPKIEKLLHMKPKEAEAEDKPKQNAYGRNIPANGYFDEKKILSGKLTATPVQQQNVQNLATQLQQNRLLHLDYSGLGDREIMEQVQKDGKPVYASGPGVLIPYFEMQPQGDRLVVYAGLNQADKQPVGTVKTVGLQDVQEVRAKFDLYLASATLVGGPFKVIGRTTLIEQVNDYAVAVQVAYKRHGAAKPAAAADPVSEPATATATRRQRYDRSSASAAAPAGDGDEPEPQTRRARYRR